MSRHQRHDLIASAEEYWITANDECIYVVFKETRESLFEHKAQPQRRNLDDHGRFF